MSNLNTLVIVLGNIVGVIIAAWLSQRNATKAQQSAAAAEIATVEVKKAAGIATERAKADAYKAQKDAADAARLLVESAKITNERLEEIKKLGTQNASVGQATHILVNNQRTVLLRLNASLATRIALENPDDQEAQSAATAAQKEAEHAEVATLSTI